MSKKSRKSKIKKSPQSAQPAAGMQAHVKPAPIQKRRYDGASRQPRTQNWLVGSGDANAELHDLTLLRNRSRDLYRNNPIAKKAIDVLLDLVIATGVQPVFSSRSKLRASAVRGYWERWANTPVNFDAAKRLNFNQMVRLALHCMFESGESLLRLRPSKGETPISIQCLEPDYLTDYQDTHVRTTQDGGWIQHGIEFTASGERLNYLLTRAHPGSEVSVTGSFDVIRVPADQIVHAYRVLRPEQHRGCPILANSIIRLRELDLANDATLKLHQIACLFSGFLKNISPGFVGTADDELPDLTPGSIVRLPDNTEISWSQPPEIPVGYLDLVKSVIRDVAGSVGLAYSTLSNDFSDSNFSSSRTGLVQQAAAVETWQWDTVVPSLLNPIGEWFIQALRLRGVDVGDITISWQMPSVSVSIDPVKEAAALQEMVSNGFMTWENAVAGLGYNPSQQLAEIAAFQAKVKEMGIDLASLVEMQKPKA